MSIGKIFPLTYQNVLKSKTLFCEMFPKSNLGHVHLIQQSPSPTPSYFLKTKYKYKWRKNINWKKNQIKIIQRTYNDQTVLTLCYYMSLVTEHGVTIQREYTVKWPMSGGWRKLLLLDRLGSAPKEWANWGEGQFLAGVSVVMQAGGGHAAGNAGLVLNPSLLLGSCCPLLRDHNRVWCYNPERVHSKVNESFNDL